MRKANCVNKRGILKCDPSSLSILNGKRVKCSDSFVWEMWNAKCEMSHDRFFKLTPSKSFRPHHILECPKKNQQHQFLPTPNTQFTIIIVKYRYVSTNYKSVVSSPDGTSSFNTNTLFTLQQRSICRGGGGSPPVPIQQDQHNVQMISKYSTFHSNFEKKSLLHLVARNEAVGWLIKDSSCFIPFLICFTLRLCFSNNVCSQTPGGPGTRGTDSWLHDTDSHKNFGPDLLLKVLMFDIVTNLSLVGSMVIDVRMTCERDPV